MASICPQCGNQSNSPYVCLNCGAELSPAANNPGPQAFGVKPAPTSRATLGARGGAAVARAPQPAPRSMPAAPAPRSIPVARSTPAAQPAVRSIPAPPMPAPQMQRRPMPSAAVPAPTTIPPAMDEEASGLIDLPLPGEDPGEAFPPYENEETVPAGDLPFQEAGAPSSAPFATPTARATPKQDPFATKFRGLGRRNNVLAIGVGAIVLVALIVRPWESPKPPPAPPPAPKPAAPPPEVRPVVTAHGSALARVSKEMIDIGMQARDKFSKNEGDSAQAATRFLAQFDVLSQTRRTLEEKGSPVDDPVTERVDKIAGHIWAYLVSFRTGQPDQSGVEMKAAEETFAELQAMVTPPK